MNSYSEDLREKIVAAVGGGSSKSQTARTFGVSLSSVKRYVNKAKRGESLTPKKSPGSLPKLDEKATKLLEDDLQERPFASLQDRCEYIAGVGTRSRRDEVQHLCVLSEHARDHVPQILQEVETVRNLYGRGNHSSGCFGVLRRTRRRGPCSLPQLPDAPRATGRRYPRCGPVRCLPARDARDPPRLCHSGFPGGKGSRPRSGSSVSGDRRVASNGCGSAGYPRRPRPGSETYFSIRLECQSRPKL